jgi:hypothetical protein
VRARRVVFWLGSFASIAVLLGHTDAVASMRMLAWAVGLPATVAMVAAWWLARRTADDDFLIRVRAGFVGGIWGGMAYDLIRIPFHTVGGLNLFVPIRAYGVWFLGVGHSEPWTDIIGFAYHLSNAVTFGWIYAFVALRRHWGWAIVWGLALETLAIISGFGAVFALRDKAAVSVLVVAYLAHVVYAYPLGRACREPEATLAAVAPPWRTRAGWLTVGVTALVFVWFVTAWQPVGRQPALAPGEIVIGPNALYPGWTDVASGAIITLRSRLDRSVTLRLRRPGASHGPGESLVLSAGETRALQLPDRGVHQLLLPGSGWRSVFVAAREGRDYRPAPMPR